MPASGRKTHTVGIAPTRVIQSMAAIESSAGSRPAMISPLTTQGSKLEPWVTNGEIIAGLEPAESSIRAIDWITSVGAIPTVCVFRPLKGTDLESWEPPETEAMVPVFRRLYEACMERGLPIGLAPNIHVSLVMLPEECRRLSDRRYPWQSLKLKAMGGVFRRQFERKLSGFSPSRTAAA